MIKCENCKTESDGKYCPECGQKLEFRRLDLKAILNEKFHSIIHWENSVLYTFRHLLTSPGQTVKDYINGTRRNIVKPLKYFLTIQTIHVLIFYTISSNYFAYINSGKDMTEPSTAKLVLIQNAISSNMKYYDYLIPIFFSLFFFLFYRKKTGINFAESFAVSLYFVGTTLLFTILTMLISLMEIRLWNFSILLNFLYLVFAFVQFSGQRKFGGILKSAAVVILSYAAYLAFVITILLIYFGVI